MVQLFEPYSSSVLLCLYLSSTPNGFNTRQNVLQMLVFLTIWHLRDTFGWRFCQNKARVFLADRPQIVFVSIIFFWPKFTRVKRDWWLFIDGLRFIKQGWRANSFLYLVSRHHKFARFLLCHLKLRNTLHFWILTHRTAIFGRRILQISLVSFAQIFQLWLNSLLEKRSVLDFGWTDWMRRRFKAQSVVNIANFLDLTFYSRS